MVKNTVYTSLLFTDDLLISFNRTNLVLFNTVIDDTDEIVIKPCSSIEELNYLLNIAFGHLRSEEVTAAMLESFCYKYLQPRIKNARK